ncbi:hypothetical protein HMI55_003645 [Coelomomyces lativittatus]|nr:hypothetical protein HMI55_003645 [Coelomomyces lativittatus]
MKAFAQDLKSIQYFYGRPVLDLDPLSPSDIQSDLKAILPQSSLPQIMYQNPHSLLYHEQFFHPGDYVLVSEYSTQSKYPGQLFSISEHEVRIPFLLLRC